MRSFLQILLLLITHCVIAQDRSAYAIRNVAVIPMTKEEILIDQTVLIRGGIIEKIGSVKKIKIPSDYTLIEGKGKYLVPGFFDMHTHFFQEQGEHKNTNESELKMMLANGLTTARIMAGHPDYLTARQKIKNNDWIGPDLFIASPQIVGRWNWGTDFKNYEVVDSPEKAFEAVKKFKQEGYDEIKLSFMVKRDVFDAIHSAAREIGIKVTGHVGPDVKLPAALVQKQQIEHMDEFIDMLLPDTTHNHGQSVSDMNIWRPNAWATVPLLDEAKIPFLIQSVKQAGVYVTPTNYFFFSSFGDGMTEEQYKLKPDYAYIPSNIKTERWQIKDRYWKNPPPESSRKKYVAIRKKITYELWKAGVPLMAGSDSPEWFLAQGFSIHDEIETFVNSGLTPFAALQTATINPAKYLGVDNIKGVIEEGKKADLIILDGNPLEEINNTRKIHGVFKSGIWISSEMKNDLLTAARILGN